MLLSGNRVGIYNESTDGSGIIYCITQCATVCLNGETIIWITKYLCSDSTHTGVCVCILKLHHCAPICILWQESSFLTAKLYNIWLPVPVCMTSMNYLSYTLLFSSAYMTARVCIMNG